MTDEEDKPLHSSDSEFLHPKKLQKHNCLQNQSDLISIQPGPPKHGQGLTNSSVEKICKQHSSNFNSHLLRSPSQKGLTDQGSVIEPNKLPKNFPVYENNNNSVTSGNQMGSTFSTTEYSENIGNNPLELLLLTLEALLEISLNQESFIQELAKANGSTYGKYYKLQGSYTSGGNLSQRYKMIGAQNVFWTKSPKDLIQVMLHQFFISAEVESYTKGTDSGSIVIGKSLFSMTMIMKIIIVCEGNPEQPIPRLIELAKLLFEWAAIKGTPYSNKEIKEKFKDSKLRQRFALLQVCATYQQFHNHEAPWPEVDEQLENLKNHSTTFRNVFHNIIFKLDNYISKKKISDIDWEKIYPPTDLEVEEEIIRIENNNFSIINHNSGEE
ncbi:hypothetical protein BY996DRAFT_6412322 [Phakopsora pachyrhizi]|nr:hypothetical protein BY996DRAFT_6412322 [Phakopsora pachyrhizi]